MNIDWNKIEKRLDLENSIFIATRDATSEFCNVIKNLDEKFYAFSFDYGTHHHHLGICLNTIEHYNNLISKYPDFDENERFEFKYNTGNWKYQSFNKSDLPSVENRWNLILGDKMNSLYEYMDGIGFNEQIDEEEAIEMYESIVESFESTLDKVIIRLKNEKSLQKLNQEDNFKVFRIDFNESVLDISQRIM